MRLDRTALRERLGRKPIVGLTASSFDLFHAGHVVMLQEARELCDYLVVGLQVDPTVDRASKNRPVQSVTERYLQVSACRYVDEVIPFGNERDLVDLILTINPDIRVVGEEYRNTEHTGKGLSPIHYNQRRHTFSTSELRDRVHAAEARRHE